MSKCPCCSEVMLRHARHSGVYWFCTHCWQEMPDLDLVSAKRSQPAQSFDYLMQSLSLAAK